MEGLETFFNMTHLFGMNSMEKTYIGLAVLTSVLSIIGSIVIILTYITIKDKRTLGRKILLYLSVCNVGSCVGTLMSVGNVTVYNEIDYRAHPTCEAAGAVSMVFNMSGYLWTGALALYLYLAICWWRHDIAKYILWPAHVICWGFPVAIMVTAILSEVVGSEMYHPIISQSHLDEVSDEGLPLRHQHRPPWCFIDRSAKEYYRWKILAGISWRMGAMIVCTIAFTFIQFYVIRKVRAPVNDDDPEDQRSEEEIQKDKQEEYVAKANRQLRHVLILFMLLNVWATWRFFVDTMRQSLNGLVVVESIADNIQGFTNFLILCIFTPDVRKAIRISCCTFCCKLRCKCGKSNTEIPVPMELEKLRPDEDHKELLQNHCEDDNEEEVHFSST